MYHFPFSRVLSAVFLLSLLTGCDSNSPNNSIVLSSTFSVDVNGDPIRFTFTSNQVQSGVLTSISCGCSLDIGPFLATRSFSKSELLSATVTSVKLKSFFPIGQRLEYLDEVQLRLNASGASEVFVANGTSFPASQEIPLSVIDGNSIETLLVKPVFGATLRVDPATISPSKVYELGVEFTVELEMEGI
jgi:hypothetical protein